MNVLQALQIIYEALGCCLFSSLKMLQFIIKSEILETLLQFIVSFLVCVSVFSSGVADVGSCDVEV